MVVICDKTWCTGAASHQLGSNEKWFSLESPVHLSFLSITNIKLLLRIDELYQHGWQRSMTDWVRVQTICIQEECKKIWPCWSYFHDLWDKWRAQVCSQWQWLACLGGAVLWQCPSIWTSMRALAKKIFMVETCPINPLWIKWLRIIICEQR